MKPGAGPGGRFPLSIAGALVFFGCLWLLDFPRPMVDDLFYTGAALNLAGGGDFSNPMLARQEFPSHYFFVYPPVHGHVLAGWLRIFGVSAASMTGFQMTMYFIIAAATIAILRKHRTPVWMEWLVPLGVNAGLFNTGLRTEPLAAAFIMTGFALVECGGWRGAAVFPGFLLVALGGLTSPRATVFAAAFAVLMIWRIWREPDPARRRWVLLALAVAAAAIAGILFLWMIGFRLEEFLHTFHFHAAGAFKRFGPGKWRLFQRFLDIQTSGQLLLMALPMVMLVVMAFKRPLDELGWAGVALAGGVLVSGLIGGLYFGSAWYVILMLLFVATSLWRRVPRSMAIVLGSVMILAFLAGNSSVLAQIASGLHGDIQTDLGPQGDEARAMAPTAAHPLLVDTCVARYVFDYRLPKGCVDFGFAARFPAFDTTQADLRAGDIYLVGPSSLMGLEQWTHLDRSAPEEFQAGRRRWTFFKHPRQVFIITAEECGGRRLSQ